MRVVIEKRNKNKEKDGPRNAGGLPEIRQAAVAD